MMTFKIKNSEEYCKVKEKSLVYVNSKEEWDELLNFIDQKLPEWRWSTGEHVFEGSYKRYNPSEGTIYHLHPVYGMHTCDYADWMAFEKISLYEFMELHGNNSPNLYRGQLVTKKTHPYKYVVLVTRAFVDSKVFHGVVLIDKLNPSMNTIGTLYEDLHQDGYELLEDLEITLKISQNENN